jgi:hypothetical protein
LKRDDADLFVLNLGRGEEGDMKKLCFDVAIETGKGSHFDPSTVIDEREIITICSSYPLRHPTITNMQLRADGLRKHLPARCVTSTGTSMQNTTRHALTAGMEYQPISPSIRG